MSEARALFNERSHEADAARALPLTEERLAVIGHELRSPVSSILNWSRVLQKSPADPDVVMRSARAIERSARLQAHLVNDLLDVSRMAGDKLKLVKARCELDGIVRASVIAVEHDARSKEIKVEYAAVDKLSVDADEHRLQQVFVNLIGNAIKFTPRGGAVAIAVDRDGTHAVIMVADTGCGIAPELLPRIFERYRQADGAARNGARGLGLGLYIVRHIVELHNGTVHAHSLGEGHGAAFTVRLPVSEVCRSGA